MAGATPEQVARFGHIASFLREQLNTREWAVRDLNRALGLPPERTNTYHWLNARMAPPKEFAAQLAKLFNVGVEFFQARDLEGSAPDPTAPLRPGPRPGVRPVPRSQQPETNPMQFLVGPHGTARIRLDVELPLARAKALFRMLLEMDDILPDEPEPEREDGADVDG